MSHVEPTFPQKFSRFFRQRELYIRSEGHVSYITLKPYMLILTTGLLIIFLLTGIISSVGYYFARNSVLAFREDLNKTTDTYKFSSNKSSVDHQEKLSRITSSTASELSAMKKQHAAKLKIIRDAYEGHLAQFQSSINLVNARMVKNQSAYLKELGRLRTVYSSLQQRHIKLEDLMDQGWAPRLVSVPVQTQTDEPEVEQKDTQSAPGNIKPKKISSLPASTRLYPTGIKSFETSMRDLWKKQNRTNAQINFSARKRVKEMVQTLSLLKFNLATLKLPPGPRLQKDTGGPFIEVSFNDIVKNSSKLKNLEFANLQPFQKIFLLEKALLELPIRRPLSDLRSITSPFGPRMDPFHKLFAMHRGVDFRAPTGEPVLASSAGVVILKESKSKSGFGKVLVIRHEYGITTLYGHLSEFSVDVGDRVKPGDVVGKVGNTGRSTGPHLHYEIRVGDSHVDPIDYLEAASHVF